MPKYSIKFLKGWVSTMDKHTTGMGKRGWFVFGAAVLLTLLTGCQKGYETLTFDEAKQDAIAVMTELVVYLDKDLVVEANEMDKPGVLFTCRGGGLSWNGSSESWVAEGTDLDPVIRRIYEDYSRNDNWRISTAEVTEDRAQNVYMYRSDGLYIGIFQMKTKKGPVLSISVGSLCFNMPDYNPHQPRY